MTMTVAHPLLEPGRLELAGHAYRLAQVLRTVVELGLPARLAGGPQTAAELAAATGADEGALERLLTVAAAEGILGHDGDAFAATAVTERLAGQADMLLGWRCLAEKYAAYGELTRCVRTGRPAIDFHERLAASPASAAAYDAAMASTVESFDACADAFALTPGMTVVDVGGGHGGLLEAVLRRWPGVRGVLFDLPRVIAGAARVPGIELVAGDLFAGVPAGADAYLLSTVLRCFDDAACVRALARCREAMAPGGRVLAVEMIERTMGDLDALVLYGGRDRTVEEWRALLAAAGLGLTRVEALDWPVAVLEAR